MNDQEDPEPPIEVAQTEQLLCDLDDIMSLDELHRLVALSVAPEALPLRVWLRLARQCFRQAQTYRDEGDFVRAYMFLLRYALLVIRGTPTQLGDGAGGPDEQRQVVREREAAAAALDELEALKASVERFLMERVASDVARLEEELREEAPPEAAAPPPPTPPPLYASPSVRAFYDRLSSMDAEFQALDAGKSGAQLPAGDEERLTRAMDLHRPPSPVLSYRSSLLSLSLERQRRTGTPAAASPAAQSPRPRRIPIRDSGRPGDSGVPVSATSSPRVATAPATAAEPAPAAKPTRRLFGLFRTTPKSTRVRAPGSVTATAVPPGQIPPQPHVAALPRQTLPSYYPAPAVPLQPVRQPSRRGLQSPAMRDSSLRRWPALESGQRLRTVHVPSCVVNEFLGRAAKNTRKKIETVGILAARLVENEFWVTTLVIPQQRGGSDACEMTHESELFEFQDRENLLTVGWIHTHPTTGCFLSPGDLHTHCAYQLMLAEAIAIVCAPSANPSVGVYRLTDPPGLQCVGSCRDARPFHEHVAPAPLYVQLLPAPPGHGSGHLDYYDIPTEFQDFSFRVVDMR